MRIGRLHVASFVLATAVFAATVARGDRRADEARIVAYAKAHANEATALLERLVNVNSGTMNPEGVREFGRILAGDIRESVRLTQQSISGSQRRIRETDQFLKNSRKVLASVHPVKPWIERIGPRLDLGPGHKGAR